MDEDRKQKPSDFKDVIDDQDRLFFQISSVWDKESINSQKISGQLHDIKILQAILSLLVFSGIFILIILVLVGFPLIIILIDIGVIISYVSILLYLEKELYKLKKCRKTLKKTTRFLFVIFTLFSSVIGLIISLSFYLSFDASYEITFSFGMLNAGIFSIFLVLHITRDFQRKTRSIDLIWFFMVMGLISEFGLILMGISPLDVSYKLSINFFFEIYRFLGIFFFCLYSISNLCLGYLGYINTCFSKILAIFSFLSGIVSTIIIIGCIILEISDVLPLINFLFI